MRILLPEDLKGKDLYEYLVANKAQLISKKKSLPIKSDNLTSTVNMISSLTKVIGERKADGTADAIEVDTGKLRVDVVANAAWWCDSYMDVPTDTCYDESIQVKGIALPHINDHIYSSTSHVGDVVAVYKKMVKLKELGLRKNGETSCVCWTTDVRKDYNEKVYMFYKNGKINQHSIGLQYLSIELAINDPEYEKEVDFWNKYIDRIINKDMVIEKGYFWLISKARLIENSCVLFGACELTPTLEVEQLTQSTEPVTTTLTTDVKKSINFASLV